MGIRQPALESVVTMALFNDAYRGRKVLLTGHTGFKGSWLTLWLDQMGAKVTGIALNPDSSPNHWELLQLDIDEHIEDIRDAIALQKIISDTQPEIVFHLAAQPLVRESYNDPLTTWATNVQGTANLLEACRHVPSVKAIVIVTSDKCYENRDLPRGYHEEDALGGHDPYSASKAASELVAASFRKSFFDFPGAPLLATARAGNVIGGGDWSEGRLIPDLVRAISTGDSLEIRSPHATRPWQHVLDALSGYLLLGQRLLQGDRKAASAWNFGPEREGNSQVIEILQLMKHELPDLQWHLNGEKQPHEAALLHLDSSKAKEQLAWKPVWNLISGISACTEWYRAYLNDQFTGTHQQLEKYIMDAQHSRCIWAG
ncbi:CDP-glucose 4,6-dehydratase [Mariprofundus aestuarium]|uniref:CDP-glucose 4,6-dehydratase n=1 Tax=Mariprofundus aestuarium TaxID=1921086 RepID=A0A2K8KV27_MARES|nr:CDP-glucose 4,6-dehydratase [Mariprofundus aestuarium]ATX78645.1 CDP-glucose 4,6-dehydratase [Mariprofundus aestuarium]